jgi:SPP1 gp7 family putative phage head morphogenesis protein
MKQLKPIRHEEKFYKNIEQKLYDEMVKAMLKPIEEIMAKYNRRIKKNAKYTALENAIQSGQVQYIKDRFEGKFNAQISKQLKESGAKYSRSRKAWYILYNNLPSQVQISIVSAKHQFKMMHDEIMEKLDADVINQRIEEAQLQAELAETYDDAVKIMDKEFQDTIKSVTVAPDLNKEAISYLTRDYTENTDLYVRTFIDEQIVDMRKKVWDNTFNGYRASTLESIITQQYQTTQKKAKFLARQETSLLLSKYKQQRYEQVGIAKYRWSATKDSRTRDRHAHLNGQIFSWNEPPVTDDNGNRNHPGEDFNCRCVAIPVIE